MEFANLQFSPNASILITGLRGVGKSTLALMASSALNYKLIDLERCVYQSTGQQESSYIQQYSIQQFREKEFEILTSKINSNLDSAIIILPSTFIDYAPSVDLILKLKKSHPIIHIHCEDSRISKYFKIDDYSKFVSIISIKKPLYNKVSNFEFYNFNSLNIEGKNQLLTLKLIERFFLNFLFFVLGGYEKSSAFLNNNHLLPIENKKSCIVQLNIPFIEHNFFNSLRHNTTVEFNLNSNSTKFTNLLGADAIELKINLKKFRNLGLTINNIIEIITSIKIFTNSYIPLIVSIENYDLPLTIPSTSSKTDASSKAQSSSDEDTDVPMHDNNNSPISQDDDMSLYFEILDLSLRLGIEYVVVDLTLIDHFEKSITSLISCNTMTKIIGSFHNNSGDKTPRFWKSSLPYQVCHAAEGIDIKYLRISNTPTSINENYDLIFFRQDYSAKNPSSSIILSLFNTGPLGKFSKIVNSCMTPVIPNLQFDKEQLGTLGHLDQFTKFDDLSIGEYLKSQIDSFLVPCLNFYVMGSNISNSLSPIIHNSAYKKLGLSHSFKIFESSNIEDLPRLFRSQNFGGTGVIMPYKVEAMHYVDNLSIHCIRIGALNTIIASRSTDNPNKIISTNGENTDWLGVKLSLLENISPINAVTKLKTALVLGAGGMSRASLYALISLGFTKILLYNRTYEKGVELADYFNSQSPIEFGDDFKEFRIHVIKSLHDKPPTDFTTAPTVIISCIPGRDLNNHIINIDVPSQWFSSPSGGVVLETGYDPLVTSVLTCAKAYVDRGWILVNGLNYLYNQALSQFEMFVGKPAPRVLMRDVTMRYFAAYNDYD